ncbi:uncharacterized protein RSE6_14481 [Rhynchosporium secalis]|uniref:Uncharacterized protein n=1 Tax=Rhynchosporium secalis TaxID=38038 RepID=A0A1E1MVF6_RHYSE|nr:uncharacterized protein RSE6_14481 [Rhynchosporium secalis]
MDRIGTCPVVSFLVLVHVTSQTTWMGKPSTAVAFSPNFYAGRPAAFDLAYPSFIDPTHHEYRYQYLGDRAWNLEENVVPAETMLSEDLDEETEALARLMPVAAVHCSCPLQRFTRSADGLSAASQNLGISQSGNGWCVVLIPESCRCLVVDFPVERLQVFAGT